MSPSRRLTTGALALAVLAGAGAWGRAEAGSSSSPGAQLMTEMRKAPEEVDFTGAVEVTWRDGSGAQQRDTVEVRAAGGVLELLAGGQIVRDDGRQTFFKDQLGWSSAPGEPKPLRRPTPDARWTLTVRRGQRRLGRPSTAVAVSRRDGTVAQRVVIDDATHLPLAREVVESDGTVSRSFAFTWLDTQSSDASLGGVPPIRARAANAITDVPAAYRAPGSAGAGYVLVSRSRHGDGIHLVYSDGVFSVSVMEQRGELDWSALPRGGIAEHVDEARARRYVEAIGDVFVWERDGVVFTCVSDAPHDVLDAMLDGLSADPGVPEQVVDFVLGPFGFD